MYLSSEDDFQTWIHRALHNEPNLTKTALYWSVMNRPIDNAKHYKDCLIASLSHRFGGNNSLSKTLRRLPFVKTSQPNQPTHVSSAKPRELLMTKVVILPEQARFGQK